MVENMSISHADLRQGFAHLQIDLDRCTSHHISQSMPPTASSPAPRVALADCCPPRLADDRWRWLIALCCV